MAIGILGIGTFLPPELRRNDWWPKEVVDGWRERQLAGAARKRDSLATAELPAGVAAAMAAMAEEGDDPFRGSRQRHVMPEGMLSSEMEAEAARRALADAGVDRERIAAVLVYSFVPDFLTVGNGCRLHHLLGLPERCFVMGTEAACDSFLMQMAVAERLLAGTDGCALLVQSCAGSRLIPHNEPHSAWFGDGAAAVVLGPVREGYGVLGQSHRADGTRHSALVVGVPGGRWWDEGRDVLYLNEPRMAHEMVAAVADRGKQAILEALAAAGRTVEDVDFFACHQATSWLRRVTQRYVGLERARAVDTFTWAASLSAANLPLVLSTGRSEGQLRDGDLVALFAGGTGETWSSAVLRWGRG